ncbi:poly(A)-specific ribonuclease [Pestalotiopsis sp. IQ-011]
MASTEPILRPARLPSAAHDVVVLLEGVHITFDDIDTAPRSHELITYHRVTAAADIRERVQCASIVIAPQCHINAESLGEAPYLKCVITPTAGTNHIDVDECRRRGVRVARCEGSTAPAVAEHVLSMYFAARRKTVIFHNQVRDVDEDGRNSWKREGSLAYKMQLANGRAPCSLDEEVVGIIGYGSIGKRLETFCRALGMQVLVSERKGAAETRPARVPFDEAVRSATVLVLCCTFTESSRHTVGAPELAAMRAEAVVINVARGGIVDAAALVRALREKRISGAAVDVFDREPASSVEDSDLFLLGEGEEAADLNLTFSPHVGYFSTKTLRTMRVMVKGHIKSHVEGDYSKFEA